ncbi:hotdog domain-containing protein [Streptomyces sp. PSRA5]|uniref:acyl-CoA thioesterase n=1 Tax=Streptomyces panacea TaxID=3035064 RepID=UPI00339C60D2
MAGPTEEPSTGRAPAPERATEWVAEPYGFLIPVAVHFDELDSFGMLYNSRYGVLVERAWVAYWHQRELAFTKDWTPLPDSFNVVKKFTITFEVPIDHPGEYGVRIWVERLGRTSLTYGFRVCSPDGGPTTYAHGVRTLIRVDPETGRPAEWSEEARKLTAELVRPAD